MSSPNAVSCHLRALEQKGYIRRSPRKRRAIELLNPPRGIPLLGPIAAGEPILAVEDLSERLDVQADFFGGGELFALRVSGDSMIGDHIVDGDVVVVRRQEDVPDGEIGAVLLEEDVTLKRVRRSHGSLELRSSNPSVQTIRVLPGGVQPRVLGQVVGVVRKR